VIDQDTTVSPGDNDGAGTSARRRARALTAWLSSEDAARLRGNPDPTRDQEGRAARDGRPPGVDQSGVLQAWPADLEAYGAALRSSEVAQTMFEDGWDLGYIADLRRVIAAQPTVFVDPAADTVDIAPSDTDAVARIALPLSPPAAQIPTRFDAERQLWVITSANPNLRITGTFGAEVQPNVLGFGFLVQVLPSFISVAELDGRLILTDGYHRTFRLLSAGVSEAPVFTRHFDDPASLFRSGMLPPEAYCGERPPTLQDYHDDRVAEEVWFEPTPTTVLVHAAPIALATMRPGAAAAPLIP